MIRILNFLIFLVLVFPPAIHAQSESLQKQILEVHSLLDQWQIEDAERLTSTLMEKHSDMGDVHFLNGKVAFFKGNYEFASETFKRIDAGPQWIKDFVHLVEETREATSGFVQQESEHFVFRFREGPDEILVHYAKEVLERSYKVLGELFEYFPKEKVIVEFYPDREPFSRISPLTLKDIVTSGTVALCKYNRLMMISPASLVRGYNWMDTLSHEYIHYLLARKSRNNVPLWINEGIAKYFESRWREDKEFLEPIGKTVLTRGLDNDYLIALEDMMPSLAKLKTAEDVQLAYAQVATMVDFLVTTKGESVIAEMLSGLAENPEFQPVFEEVSGLDLKSFQKEWKPFIKEKKWDTIPGLKVLQFQFKKDRSEDGEEKDYSELDTQKAQDHALLGDILKSRNYVDAAIMEYQKALKSTPSFSPILHNKLAGTLIMTKEYSKAETFLNESLKYYPQFHTTLTNLGEVHLLKGNHETAADYFEKAIRVNPFNPFVHQRLITIRSKLGQKNREKLQVRLYQKLG